MIEYWDSWYFKIDRDGEFAQVETIELSDTWKDAF